MVDVCVQPKNNSRASKATPTYNPQNAYSILSIEYQEHARLIMDLVGDSDPSRVESCFVIDSILSYYTDMSSKDQDTASTSPNSTIDYIAIEDVGNFPLPPSIFNPKTHNLFMMSPSSKRVQVFDGTTDVTKGSTDIREAVGSMGNMESSNLELQTNSVSQICSDTGIHYFYSKV